MAWNGTGSSWQYARWVTNIARNMRINEPTGAELTAVRTFIKGIWNPQTQTGTRSWLEGKFNRQSVTASASNYQGDIDQEPAHVLVEMLNSIGRNLDGYPLSDPEKTLADALIASVGDEYRYGTGDNFGGTSGSTVTVV